MANTKNLVIGTAIGYDIDAIKNFVISFREHNTEADLVILAELGGIQRLESFFLQFDVKPLLFETLGYFSLFTSRSVAFNSRFIRNFEFLFVSPQYKHVLMSDTRDVVFQANPFLNLPDDFLYFFTEDTNVSLGQNKFNAEWILNDYGMDTLESLKDYPIICNGTVLGSRNLILNYLRLLLSEMIRLSHNRNEKTLIVDQAITNYIAHTYTQEQLPRTLKFNGDIVGTLGVSFSEAVENNPRDEVIFDLGKVYVNGKYPAIIHQYDRNQYLANYFNNHYTFKQKIN